MPVGITRLDKLEVNSKFRLNGKETYLSGGVLTVTGVVLLGFVNFNHLMYENRKNVYCIYKIQSNLLFVLLLLSYVAVFDCVTAVKTTWLVRERMQMNSPS